MLTDDDKNNSLGRGLESLIPKRDDGVGATSAINDEQQATDEYQPLPREEQKTSIEDPSIRQASVGASEEVEHPQSPSRQIIENESSAPSSDDETRELGQAVYQLEVDKIRPNPHQPRRDFDEAGLDELASSIKEVGVLQPLVVRKIEHATETGTAVDYELIAGERRLLASKRAGLPSVPAIIRNVESKRHSLELAVIENIQREDLNPIEMARAYARLQEEFRLTQREVATRLGKSRESVANTLRLLSLPTEVQDAIAGGKVSESHGRLLLTVNDPSLRDRLFKDLIEHHMTTRELKDRVAGTGRVSMGRVSEERTPEISAFEEKLSEALGAPVKVKKKGESGRITINFYSEEELRNIIRQFRGDEYEEDRIEPPSGYDVPNYDTGRNLPEQ